MNLKNRNEKVALIMGGLTFVLFAAKPYILDLIEPSKSIGQVIGENAKDLIDSLNGKGENEHTNSKREIWSNVITIISFLMFTLSIIMSAKTFQKGVNNWLGIAGGVLSIIGLVIYLSHLTVGLFGFIVIAFLVVVIVMFDGF